MTKFSAAILMLAFGFSLTAGASQKLTPAEAVKAITNDFLGYQVFDGTAADGSACKISILNLEGPFQGITVKITDSKGVSMSVSIESRFQMVSKNEFLEESRSTTTYEVINENRSDSAIIGVTHYEDISSFDLALMQSVNRNKTLSCSYAE